MSRFSLPNFSLPTNDGHIGPAWSGAIPYPSEGQASREHLYLTSYCEGHPASRDHGQDDKQQGIASGVRALNLSSRPSLSYFPTHHGPCLVGEDGSSKTATCPEWLHPATDGEPGVGQPTRLPFFGDALHSHLDGHLASLLESSQERNPMWGLRGHPTGTSFGADPKDLYSPVHTSQEGSTSTGGTSSLASSRSLPELTWSSNDPWLGRSSTEWLQEDQEDGVLVKRDSTMQPGTVHRDSTYSGSTTLAAGPLPGTSTRTGPGDVNANRDSTATFASSSYTTGSRLIGTRMEEGSIGSKRRIWYRAPNGQFASATQALTGPSAAEANVNGEGSSRVNEGIRRIRRRRKSEEVERKYRCDFPGCEKAYGTLNRKYSRAEDDMRGDALSGRCSADYAISCSLLIIRRFYIGGADLNTHRATNEHGPRLNAVGK